MTGDPIVIRRLATLGEALAVFLVDDGVPIADSTRYRRISAGAEANVAAGFVRMGHAATYATVLGRDAVGDAVLSDLRSWGIEVVSRRSDAPTGVLIRQPSTDSSADAVNLRRGAAAEFLDESDGIRAWGDGADVVYVTGLTLVRSPGAAQAVVALVDAARESGALVVLDPNLRRRIAPPADFRAALEVLRGKYDIALGDPVELGLLVSEECSDPVADLLESGCQLVVEKSGAAGVVARDGHNTIVTPSGAQRVVDTVGAGDAFTAGLLSGIVEGLPLALSLDRAAGLAAAVVETPGDVEGIPWRRTLLEKTGAER